MNRRILLLIYAVAMSSHSYAQPINSDMPSNNPGLSFINAINLVSEQSPKISSLKKILSANYLQKKASGNLPDPMLSVMLDEIPVSGEKKGKLSESMQVIGFRQPMLNNDIRFSEKKMAESEYIQTEIELYSATKNIKTQTATTWINLFYINKQFELLDKIKFENELLQKASIAQASSGEMLAELLMPIDENLNLDDSRDALLRDKIKQQAIMRSLIGDYAYKSIIGELPKFINSFSQDDLEKSINHHPEMLTFITKDLSAKAEISSQKAMASSEWNWGVFYKKRPPKMGDQIALEVEFSLPLWSESRQKPKISAAEEKLNSLSSEKENTHRVLYAEINNDWAMINNLNQQLNRIEKQTLPLLQNRLQLLTVSFSANKVKLSDLILIRKQIIEKQISLVKLMQERDGIFARLYYLFLDTDKTDDMFKNILSIEENSNLQNSKAINKE